AVPPAVVVPACTATAGEAVGTVGAPASTPAAIGSGTAVRASEVAGAPDSGEPHWLQKRASCGLPAPQTGHVCGKASGWPHSMQNRALFGLLVPQVGQIMRTPGTL